MACSAWAAASATVKPVPCMVRPSGSEPIMPRRKISSPVSTRKQVSELISASPYPVARVHLPVLPVRAGVGDHRLQIELNLELRHREALDDEPGTDRVVAAKVVGHRPVNRHPPRRIGEIGGDHGDVVEARPRLLEQRLRVLHRLVGLSRRIGRVAEPVVEVEAGLPAQVDAVSGPHGHAHVVVVPAPGVDVPGVELAQALNHHLLSRSRRARRDVRTPSRRRWAGTSAR